MIEKQPPRKAPALECAFTPGYLSASSKCHDYLPSLQDDLAYPYMEGPKGYLETALDVPHEPRPPPYHNKEALARLEGRPPSYPFARSCAKPFSWAGNEKADFQCHVIRTAPDLARHPAFRRRRDIMSASSDHESCWAGDELYAFRQYVTAAHHGNL